MSKTYTDCYCFAETKKGIFVVNESDEHLWVPYLAVSVDSEIQCFGDCGKLVLEGAFSHNVKWVKK